MQAQGASARHRPKGCNIVRILGLLVLFAVLSGLEVAAQKVSRLTTTPPLASVQGRVTVHMAVGRTFGEHPVAKLPLYLIHIDNSKALQDLQRKCRRALAQTQTNPAATYDACMRSLADAARIVPQMASTATAETDRDGYYKFESVPAGRRYQVVGVRYDGEDPVVIVGLTSRLKAGEKCKINLSENAAWTDAVPARR